MSPMVPIVLLLVIALLISVTFNAYHSGVVEDLEAEVAQYREVNLELRRKCTALSTDIEDAFRQGKLAQALLQADKDSTRAKKAAQTRRAQLTAPDRRGAP